MSQTPTVHSLPETVSGELVFVGTRVPVRNLLDWIKGGHTHIDEGLDNFASVTREQAIAFLEQATGVPVAPPAGGTGVVHLQQTRPDSLDFG
jgi:uncharacterized protein (DUF433 family)